MATVIATRTSGAITNRIGLAPQPGLCETATARNIHMGIAPANNKKDIRLIWYRSIVVGCSRAHRRVNMRC
jgi:hypothetical protein